MPAFTPAITSSNCLEVVRQNRSISICFIILNLFGVPDVEIRSSDRWQGEPRRRCSVFRYGGGKHDSAPGSCTLLLLVSLQLSLLFSLVLPCESPHPPRPDA